MRKLLQEGPPRQIFFIQGSQSENHSQYGSFASYLEQALLTHVAFPCPERDCHYKIHLGKQEAHDDIRQLFQNLCKSIKDTEKGSQIILMGHSMGGIFARFLAELFPDKVESVITFGSPHRWGERNMQYRVTRKIIQEILKEEGCGQALPERERQMPIIAFSGKQDEIFPERSSRIEEREEGRPESRNILLGCDHEGYFDKAFYQRITEALQQWAIRTQN